MDRRIDSAAALTLPELAALFTEGFSGYLLPMHFTAEALAERICAEHIDVAASRVLWVRAGDPANEKPAGIALIARRGRVCRLAAMGIAPGQRSQGAGRDLLAAV